MNMFALVGEEVEGEHVSTCWGGEEVEGEHVSNQLLGRR